MDPNSNTLSAGVTVYLDNTSLVKLVIAAVIIFVAFFAIKGAMNK